MQAIRTRRLPGARDTRQSKQDATAPSRGRMAVVTRGAARAEHHDRENEQCTDLAARALLYPPPGIASSCETRLEPTVQPDQYACAPLLRPLYTLYPLKCLI